MHTLGSSPIRCLLDQNAPRGLRTAIIGHEISTARQMGWDTFENGILIAAAEQAGFDVLVTCDQNLLYQQNLTARRLALVVLTTNRWPFVRAGLSAVQAAIDASTTGSFQLVPFDRPVLRRRPFNRPPDRYTPLRR